MITPPHPTVSSRVAPALVAFAALLHIPGMLVAETFQSLAQRLPASTDTIVAINVAKVLDSPLAQQQQWRNTMAENWTKHPQVVPPGVKKLLMGAEFIPSKTETRWEVTLMEMEKMPALKDLCQAEGGHIDRVWDKDAVASPINAYFVPIGPSVLAVCTPAERSVIARWVRQPVQEGGVITSEYTRAVLAGLGEQSDVLMAMDLEGAFGLPNVRRFLAGAEMEQLKGRDLDSLAVALATLKGLTLQITVDQAINANVTISFGNNIEQIGEAAKPLLIAALNVAGMHLDDLDEWTFTAAGKDVRGKGKLSEASFRQLVGVVQSPVPSAVAATAQPAGAKPMDPATASQRYFKSVCAIIDGLKPGISITQTSTWAMQAAKRIEKLPILNVDPALVEWAGFISSKLKQVAGVGAVGQTQLSARVDAAGTWGNSYYDENGYYHYDDSINKSRRQAATEQKAQIQQQAAQILGEANGSRQKIRVEMTNKYNVEF